MQKRYSNTEIALIYIGKKPVPWTFTHSVHAKTGITFPGTKEAVWVPEETANFLTSTNPAMFSQEGVRGGTLMPKPIQEPEPNPVPAEGPLEEEVVDPDEEPGFVTPCGKVYSTKARGFFNKHVGDCEDCAKISARKTDGET